MQDVILCNASQILSDAEVLAVVPSLQKQFDEDFLPPWEAHGVKPISISFATMADIPQLPPDCWPIFLNRHSLEGDEGTLGWHNMDVSENIDIFSRVFLGDILRFGLSWTVTVSHELLELALDPDIRRVFRMGPGHYAALEACDAVESDDQAYDVLGHKMSNFVLPAYFSHSTVAPFDFRSHLKAPCPSLTAGGYMSIRDNSGWRQIYANRVDGLPGRRALAQGHRRQSRANRSVVEFEVWGG